MSCSLYQGLRARSNAIRLTNPRRLLHRTVLLVLLVVPLAVPLRHSIGCSVPGVPVQKEDSFSVLGWKVALSVPGRSSFSTTTNGGGEWITGFGGPQSSYVLTGDFDGDGKTDIAGWNQEVKGWHVAISTGTRFDASVEGGGGFWVTNFGDPTEGYMLTGNFNGPDEDGKMRTDIATWNAEAHGWQVALSKPNAGNPATKDGRGFVPFRASDGQPDVWISDFGQFEAPIPGQILTGDFDGDGKTDLASWNRDLRGWHVALSKGDRFDQSASGGGGVWITNWVGKKKNPPIPDPGTVLTGDFNGDGKTDLARWNADKRGWQVATSDGTKFEFKTDAVWTAQAEPSPGLVFTGDFDGDGRTDLAYIQPVHKYRGEVVVLSSHHDNATGKDEFTLIGSFWITDFGKAAWGYVLVGDFNGPDDDKKSRADVMGWDLLTPQAPSHLHFTDIGPDSITVEWDAHGDSTGFEVEADGLTNSMNDEDGTARISKFGGLKPGEEYTIKIQAYNQAPMTFGERRTHSSAADPIKVKTLPNGYILASQTVLLVRVSRNFYRGTFSTPASCEIAGFVPEFRDIRLTDESVEFSYVGLGSDPLRCGVNDRKVTGKQGVAEVYGSDALTFMFGPGFPGRDIAGCSVGGEPSIATIVYYGTNATSCAADLLTIVCPGVVNVAAPPDELPYPLGYSPPAVNRQEGTYAVICSPPPFSLFPLGTTTVTCTATDNEGGEADCSFKVIVVKAPLALLCPANLVTAAPTGAISVLVNYPPPSANSHSAAVACSPPSGSSFPVGLTLVRCNATDGPAASASCSFLVRVREDRGFDLCLQDDASGDTMEINSATGEYRYTRCGAFTISGLGSITEEGEILVLENSALDRRVVARYDGAQKTGSATVQLLLPPSTFTIMDRLITDNTCACP